MPKEILFEGLTQDQILKLPPEEIQELVLLGEPIVFRIGSAKLFGSFKVEERRLVIELAQIEGGGEGVLLSLGSVARRYAQLRGLTEIEWIVLAVSCARPNPRLRAMLEHRGFTVRPIPDVGDAYHLVESV
ncbi:MAG TPA: hypothetical protein VHN74_14350 [Candidatus Angelobacter sp.]|jgi:hypothetical protein|nr:hypothetical protein [Candidatus Angelobacter sp.]